MKRLTKADILSIRPGERKTFSLDTAKAVMSSRQYAYLLGKIEPAKGIAKYRTNADFVNKTITITAVPSNQ